MFSWVESTGKLTDYQNEFREKRSAVDRLTTVTSLIENKKEAKKKMDICCIRGF